MNLVQFIKPAGKLVGDLIKFAPGGFSPDEGRQLAADALSLAGGLATLVPAPVGPLVSGVLTTIGQAVAAGHDIPTMAQALIGIITDHAVSTQAS